MTEPLSWTASAASRTCRGSATSVAAAWSNAASAALQLARDTNGADPLRLHVQGEGEPAEVQPARTEGGDLDLEATSAVLTRLVHAILDTGTPPAGVADPREPPG